jgi:hypothetical protein
MFPEPVLARLREFRLKLPVKSLEIDVFPESAPENVSVVVDLLEGTDGDQPGLDLKVTFPLVLLFV